MLEMRVGLPIAGTIATNAIPPVKKQRRLKKPYPPNISQTVHILESVTENGNLYEVCVSVITFTNQ